MRLERGARARLGPVWVLVFCLALLPALLSCTQRPVPSPLVNPLEETAGGAREADDAGGGTPGAAGENAKNRHDVNPQRVSPVYEQWLFRQSMLAQGASLLSSLPRTLLWRHSGYARNVEPLLQAAPTWFFADVSALGPNGVEKLEKALPALASLSVSGLWLSRSLESDLAWVPENVEKAHAASPQSLDEGLLGSGRAASFSLAPSLGDDKEHFRLVQALADMGMQGGMGTVAAATGLGPDFMLEARGSSRHQGLYALWEVPAGLFCLLPAANGPWDVKALDGAILAALREKKVLPGYLSQEAGSMGPKGAGFAATGEVLCVDGQTRRYVYRHAGSPLKPVLDWGHPAGSARSLLLASSLRTTGVLRDALAGLDVSALCGLDTKGDGSEQDAYEPAQTALTELASMVRRCGGWSLALNPADAGEAKMALDAADFVEAPGFSAAVQQALETGSARELASLLQGLKGLETRRLAFAARAPEPMRERTDGEQKTVPKTAKKTAPGTAAGIGKEAGRDAQEGADKTAVESSKDREARRVHLSQALSVGLPGLCLLDGMTLLERGFSRQGGAPSPAALLLRDALEARARLDLARGALVQVEAVSENALVAVSALPGGGSLVTALNFSGRDATLRVNPRGGTALEPLTPGAAAPQGMADGAFSFTLKAGQAAHYLTRR